MFGFYRRWKVNRLVLYASRDAHRYLEEIRSKPRARALKRNTATLAAACIWGGVLMARWFPDRIEPARKVWGNGSEDRAVALIETFSFAVLALYVKRCVATSELWMLEDEIGFDCLDMLGHEKRMAKLMSEALNRDPSAGLELFDEIAFAVEEHSEDSGDMVLPHLVYIHGMATWCGVRLGEYSPSEEADDPVGLLLGAYAAGGKQFLDAINPRPDATLTATLQVAAWLDIAYAATIQFLVTAGQEGNLTFPYI